jgi:hypothetical protein
VPKRTLIFQKNRLPLRLRAPGAKEFTPLAGGHGGPATHHQPGIVIPENPSRGMRSMRELESWFLDSFLTVMPAHFITSL